MNDSLDSAEARRAAGIEEILAGLREQERQAADAAAQKLLRLNKELALRMRNERIQFFNPHPKQKEFYSAGAKWRRRVILGGNRCLAPWQRIYDPVDGTNVAVSERDKPFHVHAWDGRHVVVAEAMPSFRKDRGNIYRVRLSNGSHFDASGTHLVRTMDEYKPVSSLGQYERLFNPQHQEAGVEHVGPVFCAKELIGEDWKWDFTVPKYGNYIIDHTVHHNSGKSEGACAEAAAHALGHRPWLQPDHPDYIVIHPATGRPIKTPNIGLIAAESFTEQVQKVIVPKLVGPGENGIGGLIPFKHWKRCKRNQQGVVVEIHLKNPDSIIYIKSYEQESKLFESDAYDWYYPDEPPPREHYIAMQRGAIDTRAPMWFAMTPLKEAWIFDELVQKTSEVFSIYFDMRDNVGYGITEEAVAEFESQLTDDEKEQRIHGKFFHLGGVVYKKYGTVHRVPRPIVSRGHSVFNSQWGFYMAIDCHPREPHAALWLGVHPLMKKFVIGELLNDHPQNLVSHFCSRMREYEEDFLGISRFGDPIRLIDSISYTPDPISGGSVWDEFATHGFVCGPGAKDPMGGIRLAQKELNYEPTKGEFPSLFFYDDLPEIHWQMGHYAWLEWSRQRQQQANPRPQPRKKRDHLVECLHRILLANPEPGAYLRRQDKPDEGGGYGSEGGAFETDVPSEGY